MRLRIEVDNRLQDAGLWRVDFPSITGLGYIGASDVARPRENHGFLYRRMARDRHGTHPSADWPMQFLSLTCGKGTLYLGSEDGKASHKGFEIAAGEHYRIYTFPPGMTKPGQDYHQSYDSVLEAIDGDWYDAARRYCRWALGQPWMRQGTIAQRTDTPEAFKRISLWILSGGNGDTFVANVLKAQEVLDVPMGVHWYGWYQTPFGYLYPHCFPVKPGFIENVPKLTEKGIYVMPYINGRLWDPRADDFAQARTFACKDVDGEHYIEFYGDSPPASPMCPYTEFWHQTIADLVMRLKYECEVNAIYFDQIGGMTPINCFDATHGHSIGGGDWWAQGYRDMMKKMRAITGPDIALTTENNCETFGDFFAMLIWTPRRPDIVPLYTTVYGDRIIRFGSRIHDGATLNETTFAIKFGRDFLWGGQLGWTGTWFLGDSNTAKLFRRLVRLRAGKLLPFLAFGDMVRSPNFTDPVPRINCPWDSWMTPTMPTIVHAAWRAPDGRVAAIFVNCVSQPHQGSVDLSGLIEFGHTYEVIRCTLDEQQVIGTVDSDEPVVAMDFPAYDGVALILEAKAL